MDPLGSVLTAPRAEGAFLLRSILNPPWSLRIQDEAPLTVIAVVRGEAWLLPDHSPPTSLRPGDVAIVRGPDRYTVADHPATAPTVIIHPGQISTTMDGETLCEVMDLGVRSWGDSVDGASLMLTGTYQQRSEIGRLLLGTLPAVIVVRDEGWDCPYLALLSAEMTSQEAGQEVVLDRLLDLVLLATLREWLSREDSPTPRWYRAAGDPVVATALESMQSEPGRPWTVASLAAGSGVSRAAFARRFTELVGAPPMAYLTEWRLALAADLLREPEATIGSVARHVGYGSAFALSTAFKRIRGVSPTQYRSIAAAG